MLAKKKKKKLKYSDGVYHARITLALTPAAALLTGAAFFIPLEWPLRVLMGALGCLFGIVCSPDNDIDGWNIGERIWFKIPIIGYSLGYLWSWFWMPYAALWRHRGTSHSILLGTLGRVLYLLLWTPVTILGLTLSSIALLTLQGAFVEGFNPAALLQGYLNFILTFWVYGICFCIGLFISDLGHLARDFWGWQI